MLLPCGAYVEGVNTVICAISTQLMSVKRKFYSNLLFSFIVTGSLSYMGVFFGISASLCVALNAIFTKKILPAVNNNVWRLALYNNINGSVIFLPLIIFAGEIPVIYRFEHITSLFFWGVMLGAGVAGFAIGYVTGLQIQFTSPLTHNISGTAKACAQTVMGSAWFQESRSPMWWFSNMVVLLGSFLYTIVKRNEMAQAQKNSESQKVGDAGKPLLTSKA